MEYIETIWLLLSTPSHFTYSIFTNISRQNYISIFPLNKAVFSCSAVCYGAGYLTFHCKTVQHCHL